MIAAIPIRWSNHEDDQRDDNEQSPAFHLSLLDDNALDQMDMNEQTGSYTTNTMYDEEDSGDNMNENENTSSEDNASESDQSIEDQQTSTDYNGENQSMESNAVEGRSTRGPIIVSISKKKRHPFHIYSYDKKDEQTK